MPRIRCHYADCIFLEGGFCAASAVELDPEDGCLTYTLKGEISEEQAWKDNESLEEEWSDAGFEPEDESADSWLEVGPDEEEDIPEGFDIEEEDD